jgi:hypothetical protein
VEFFPRHLVGVSIVNVRVADIYVSDDGRDRPQKAMKMVAAALLSTCWRSGQMSFDFGELETECKFDVGAHCMNR